MFKKKKNRSSSIRGDIVMIYLYIHIVDFIRFGCSVGVYGLHVRPLFLFNRVRGELLHDTIRLINNHDVKQQQNH